MPQNRPLAVLLTVVLALAVLVLLLVGGSLAWLDAEGAEEEFPQSYRLSLTCPQNYIMVIDPTPNTWWRAVYVGQPANDATCWWGGICRTRWTRPPADGVWSMPLYQNDGAVIRRNLLVEIIESYDRPLDARLWPASSCGTLTWLPAVQRY